MMPAFSPSPHARTTGMPSTSRYRDVYKRQCFHISLLIDVSPFCDCYGLNDAPVIPDVGMFASFDPVAIDQACAAAANREHAIADSFLGEKHPACLLYTSRCV